MSLVGDKYPAGTKFHHQLLQIFGRGGVGRDGVGPVALFSMRGVDVPSSPAVFERSAVIGDNRFRPGGHSLGIREHRADEDAGHAQGRSALMAMQTNLAALEARLSFFVRGKNVEDRAADGIDGRNFHGRTSAHVTDRDFVVKINRARIARRNLRAPENWISKKPAPANPRLIPK